MTENTITSAESGKRIAKWDSDRAAIKDHLEDVHLKDLPVLNINAFTFKLDEMFELCVRIYNANHPEQAPIVAPPSSQDDPINAIRFYPGIKEVLPNTACLIAVPVKCFQERSYDDGGEDI